MRLQSDNSILLFAAMSSHQMYYCMQLSNRNCALVVNCFNLMQLSDTKYSHTCIDAGKSKAI